MDLILIQAFYSCISCPVVCSYAVMNMNFCLFCIMQSEANPEAENQLAGAESQQNEVRVQYTEPDNTAEQVYSDQDGSASGGEHTTKHTSLDM